MTFESHNPATGEFIGTTRNTRRKQTSASNVLGTGGEAGRARPCMSARLSSFGLPICWIRGRKPTVA
jgi:hypothetical protein